MSEGGRGKRAGDETEKLSAVGDHDQVSNPESNRTIAQSESVIDMALRGPRPIVPDPAGGRRPGTLRRLGSAPLGKGSDSPSAGMSGISSRSPQARTRLLLETIDSPHAPNALAAAPNGRFKD
jgi:hypothetical protein